MVGGEDAISTVLVTAERNVATETRMVSGAGGYKMVMKCTGKCGACKQALDCVHKERIFAQTEPSIVGDFGVLEKLVLRNIWSRYASQETLSEIEDRGRAAIDKMRRYEANGRLNLQAVVLKQSAEGLDIDSKQYISTMFSYHDLMADHHDSMVGSVSDDDHHTGEWRKHCKARDRYFAMGLEDIKI